MFSPTIFCLRSESKNYRCAFLCFSLGVSHRLIMIKQVRKINNCCVNDTMDGVWHINCCTPNFTQTLFSHPFHFSAAVAPHQDMNYILGRVTDAQFTFYVLLWFVTILRDCDCVPYATYIVSGWPIGQVPYQTNRCTQSRVHIICCTPKHVHI